MRESCLVYCYSGIQSLFEVVLLYTFYTIVTDRIARPVRWRCLIQISALSTVDGKVVAYHGCNG